MGGAFGENGHRGNVSPVAEANIAGDPHAADLVFGARWPVTIVGLDVLDPYPAPVAPDPLLPCREFLGEDEVSDIDRA